MRESVSASDGRERPCSCLVRRHYRLLDPKGRSIRRSVALEPAFWAALDAIAPGRTLRELIERSLAEVTRQRSLVSILRCVALNHYRALSATRARAREDALARPRPAAQWLLGQPAGGTV